MEKVKLSKNQSKALEHLLGKRTPKEILTLHLSDHNGWIKDAECLNGIEFDILAKALYNGYEIELTPEEKLDKLYKQYEHKFLLAVDIGYKNYYQGVCHGLKIAKENLIKL